MPDHENQERRRHAIREWSDTLHAGDNLALLARLPQGLCDLVYLDPPFGTNVRRSAPGEDRRFDDRWPGGAAELVAFLEPRIEQVRRVMSEHATLYLHLDYRAAAYARVALDRQFGPGNFLNEVIWHYRTGGLSRRWFARKHDTILVYAKHAGRHRFNVLRDGAYRTDGLNRDEEGRPYKSTRRGRVYFNRDGPALTDVWDVPFLSTVSAERVGWPTQKPLALLERIVRASSDEGDLVADFFCGSGTTLVAAARLGRSYLGCDQSAAAIALAKSRLANQAGAALREGLGPRTFGDGEASC